MESFNINYRTIDITVADDRIIGDGVSIGAENGHDDVRLMIRFSPMWSGTAKTVYWTDAQGVECEVTLLAEPNTNDAQNAVYQASVPVSVRRYPGAVGVTIFGAIIDPDTDMEIIVMATEKAEFRVLPGVGSDVTSGAEIPATFAEQIQTQLNAAVAAVGEAVEGAEASATAAEESATAAEESATAAAGSAATAAELLAHFETPTAEAETLPAGSDATAEYRDGVFTFGIPQGAKGDKGGKGDKGDKGDKGEPGARGLRGFTGPQGVQGEQGSQGPQGTAGMSAYASAQAGGYAGTEQAFYTDLATVSTKQDALPTVVLNRFLHTNAITGNLEWAETPKEIALYDYQNIPGTNEIFVALQDGKIPVYVDTSMPPERGIYICCGGETENDVLTYYFLRLVGTTVRYYKQGNLFGGQWSGSGSYEVQKALVSGTNIKTINSQSVLGSGNLQISGMPSVTTSDAGKFARVNSSGEWVAESVPQYQGGSY